VPDFAPVTAGFSQPERDAQQTFRRVLDALARPGTVQTLHAGAVPAAPACGGPALAAVCLTLLDFETPVWLGPSMGGLWPFIQFHCGAPRVTRPDEAAFAIAAPVDLPALDAFRLGEPEYPDRSTTLVVEVHGLFAVGVLRLRGPGIETVTSLGVAGLPPTFWPERATLAPLFPLGLDVILTCGETLAGLPRTTIVEGV
jgi:alpha-D-ribose 1-methylphosphonate 5-triphosphate synthase subunit PhnH